MTEAELLAAFRLAALPASAYEAWRNTVTQPDVGPRSTVWVAGKPYPFSAAARLLHEDYKKGVTKRPELG